MPLFCVSCGDRKITISGFELSFGKNISESYYQNGSPLMLLIVIPSIILLILSFFIIKTKKILLFKTIFIILPIFNIFAIFTVKYIINPALLKIFVNMSPEKNYLINILSEFIIIEIQPGFILYVIFNAVVFIFSSINYFKTPTQ